MELHPGTLRRSRAESTCFKYEGAFIRRRNWALRKQLGSSDILLAKAFPVALYLESLLQSAKTPAPGISAFYMIKWMQNLYARDSSTDSKIVAYVLESAKRILSTQTNKKESKTLEILFAMYKRINKDKDLMS